MDSITFARWEPGNATGYDLCLVFDYKGDGYALFSWTNRHKGGACMRVDPREFTSLDYLMEKMGVNEADGAALLGWLRSVGIHAEAVDGYSATGGRL
jgi:hypothetical protein